jgi:heme/copper-type cytochrome/quinol oxidase subunit 3
MRTAESLAEERAARTASAPVLGMVLFVASEAMFFAAFFAIYALNFSSHDVWPPKNIKNPSIGLATIMTAAMVVSSVLLQVGLRAIRGGRTRPFTRLLGVALALGLAFVALQIVGLSQVSFGIKDGAYGSLFYVMSGVALAHVVGGIMLLAMVLTRTVSGQLSMIRHEPAEAATIYWHFVVVVTIVLYVLFYVVAATHLKGP